MEVSKKLLLINSSSSVLTRLLSLTVLVWMHQYLLRRVSPEEYAIYPVVAAVMIFAPFVTSVFAGGIARYIVEAFAQGDEQRVTRIVSSIFPFVAVLSCLFLAAGLGLSWFVGDLLAVPSDRLWDARIMMALFVFGHAYELLLLPFSVGLYVRQRFVHLSLITLGTELFRVALLFTLLFAVSTRVLWVVVAAVAGSVLAITVTTWLSRRATRCLRFRPRLFSWELARTLTSFGAWSTLGYVAYRIRTSADAIILNQLGTPVDVNAFHVGSIPDRQINRVSASVTQPMQPMLTAMHATGNRAGLREWYLRGNRLFLWGTMLAAVPLIAFGPEIVDLYVGSTYGAAAGVMLFLYAGYAFMGSTTMLYRVALAKAEIKQLTVWSLVTQALNVALTIYVVGALGMGAEGAALSTLVTTGVMHVLVFWPMGLRMTQLTASRFVRETLVPGLVPACAAVAACVALRWVAVPETWPAVFAWCGTAAAVYAAVLAVFCLRPADRADLAKLLGKLRARLRLAPTSA